MTGEDTGQGGRRRDQGADVVAELAALRRKLSDTDGVARESAGLLAELAPIVLDGQTGLTTLRAQVAALVADAEDTAAEDPAVTAAKTEIGMRPDPPWPWRWHLFDAEQATAAWDQLGRWVGEVLVPDYRLTRAALPDCWPRHPEFVSQLSWLRGTYLDAYSRRSAPARAADWHLRHLPGVLAAIEKVVKPDQSPNRYCGPGHHDEKIYGETGAEGAELATVDHWGTTWREVSAADVARRRTLADRDQSSSSNVNE